MPRLIWVFAGRTLTLLVTRRLKCHCYSSSSGLHLYWVILAIINTYVQMFNITKYYVFMGMTYDFQPSCGENRLIFGDSLEILSRFVGSARLWESAPFVGLTLFVSLTYILNTHKNGSMKFEIMTNTNTKELKLCYQRAITMRIRLLFVLLTITALLTSTVRHRISLQITTKKKRSLFDGMRFMSS